MTGLARLADDCARALSPTQDWDALRDELDMLTGGDLDTTQLDLLTDMVARRGSQS